MQVTSLADGTTHFLNATREVILSAGALHSPQLLMLSGVGPAQVLSDFAIDVVADRPGVGQNLTDHVLFGPSYEVVFDTLDKVLHDPIVLAESIATYALAADGPLTTNVAEFLAFERLTVETTNLSQAAWDALDASLPGDWPHVEYFPANGFIGNFSIPWLDQPDDGKQYVSILAALVAPQSRGQVTLASSVVPGGELEEEYFPGTQVETYDEILAIIRTSVMAVMHASCTNRMGTSEDPTAVVDSLARVMGVHALRVVDASALALLPPGHPQALVYALAEKIADDIIQGRQ